MIDKKFKLQTEIKPKINKTVKLLREVLQMIEDKKDYDNKASKKSKDKKRGKK